MIEVNRIIQGDALKVLKTLPDESIDCCITSPPYWALRDYGIAEQLGLELTVQEYIIKLCNVFDEIKRLLKKEGSCWVNLGDTFYSDYGGANEGKVNPEQVKQLKSAGKNKTKTKELPISCLTLIGSRLAIEMCNRNWILRNEIIWHKPNSMPSSAKNRFTVDFEKIFFFVKNKKYYFKQLLEPNIGSKSEKYGMPARFVKLNPQGHNKRCVWSIMTKGYRGAHFATFPEKLVEPMIKAGCPQGGICLDPFMGAGTTGVVAKKLGRNYIGVELSEKYIEMANLRIQNTMGCLI